MSDATIEERLAAGLDVLLYTKPPTGLLEVKLPERGLRDAIAIALAPLVEELVAEARLDAHDKMKDGCVCEPPYPKSIFMRDGIKCAYRREQELALAAAKRTGGGK